jgi:hypothetical protein
LVGIRKVLIFVEEKLKQIINQLNFIIMAKASVFQTEIQKRLEGKSKADVGQNIERLAKAHVSGQIHALEGSIVQKEMAVEVAKEKLSDAKYPTDVNALSDASTYIKGIVDADKAVKKAEKELEGTQELLSTLKEMVKTFAE